MGREKKIFFADGQDGANSLGNEHELEFWVAHGHGRFYREFSLTANTVRVASQQRGVPILRSFE